MVNQDTNHWINWSDEELLALAHQIHVLFQTPEGWSSRRFATPDAWEVYPTDSFYIQSRRPMPNYPNYKEGIMLSVPIESAVYLASLDTNAAKALMAANVQAAINSAIQVPPGTHYPVFFFSEDLL